MSCVRLGFLTYGEGKKRRWDLRAWGGVWCLANNWTIGTAHECGKG